VKNKRLEVCQQVSSLGFLHVKGECDDTQHKAAKSVASFGRRRGGKDSYL